MAAAHSVFGRQCRNYWEVRVSAADGAILVHFRANNGELPDRVGKTKSGKSLI
jgi:hypothetical protein